MKSMAQRAPYQLPKVHLVTCLDVTCVLTVGIGGLLYYEGDSDAASLNPALNAAMLMTRYANIASTDDKKRQYLNFAQSQVDYWLGNNPMSGTCSAPTAD